MNSDDLAKFFKTAIELYNLWPSFFYSVAGLIISIVVGLVTVTWGEPLRSPSTAISLERLMRQPRPIRLAR